MHSALFVHCMLPYMQPTESKELKALSFKMPLLLTSAFEKHVGNLKALSVNGACIQFGPGDCIVTLTLRYGYIPKVLSAPFWAQVMTLQVASPIQLPERSPIGMLCVLFGHCGQPASFVWPSSCLSAMQALKKAIQSWSRDCCNG